MAIVYISGKQWEFTITGHTDNGPIVGATITNNGATWVVSATNVTGGSGIITAYNAGANSPALITQLVCAPSNIPSGKWTAQVPDGDVHFKEIPPYAAGDTLYITNNAKSFVRLILDATDAADAARLLTRPNILGYQLGASAELLIRNTSTVTPMVFEFNTMNQSNGLAWLGELGRLRVEGEWIELAYVSDGTMGQSFNLDIQDVNGRYIDNPPFMEAQTIAGDNTSWKPILNIGGGDPDTPTPYKWKSNTNYLNTMYMVEFGRQYESGPVFEFDEYNGGAAYGKVYLGKDYPTQFWVTTTVVGNAASPVVGNTYTANAGADTYQIEFIVSGSLATAPSLTHRTMRLRRTAGTGVLAYNDTLTRATGSGPVSMLTTGVSQVCGGWVPPNGAKFRIPNIHFTVNRASATSPGTNTSGMCLVAIGGAYGNGKGTLTRCSFSDLLNGNGACWNYFNSVTFTDVGIVNSSWYTSGTNKGAMTYNGFNVAPSKNLSSGGFTLGQGNAPFNVNGILTTNKGNISIQLNIQPQMEAQSIKGVHVIYPIGSKITPSYQCLSLTSVRSAEDTPCECSDWTLIGHSAVQAQTFTENLHVEGIRFSGSSVDSFQPDQALGCTAIIQLGSNVFDMTMKNFRLITGGTSIRAPLLGGSCIARNITLSDVLLDSRNSNNGVGAGGTILGAVTDDMWASNIEVEGFSGVGNSVMQAPRANGRMSNIKTSTVSTALQLTGGAQVDNVCGTSGPGGSIAYADAPPFQVVRTGGGSTTGDLAIALGYIQNQILTRIDDLGTYGVDMYANGAYWYCQGYFTCRWINQLPIKGITDIPGTVVVSNPGQSVSQIAFSFRMAKWGDALAGSYQTLNAANLASAFDALTGYDSDVGLLFELKVDGSAAQPSTWGRYVQNVQIIGVTLDPTYTPSELGFLGIGVFGLPENTSVALVKGGVVVDYVADLGASGEFLFSFPCNFLLAGEAYTIVARQAGFQESQLSGTAYIKPLNLPLSLSTSEPCTDASVASISIDGGTTGISLSGNTTFAQLYQASQNWAHQRSNMTYQVPVTSNGVAGYTSVFDIDVTGFVLNGTGSLGMGAKLLTSDDLFNYTYTGGTFSQLTTTPTFDGGTLTLPIAITTSPGFTMASGTIVFGATSADWNLSTCVIGSGVVLSTTVGPITVEMPAGYPAGVTGSGATQITVISAVATLTIDSNISLLGAEIRVYDLDNTPSGSLGTELPTGTESCLTTTYDYVIAGGNTVWIQILKSGYKEFGQSYVTSSSSATFTAILEADRDA